MCFCEIFPASTSSERKLLKTKYFHGRFLCVNLEDNSAFQNTKFSLIIFKDFETFMKLEKQASPQIMVLFVCFFVCLEKSVLRITKGNSILGRLKTAIEIKLVFQMKLSIFLPGDWMYFKSLPDTVKIIINV